MSDALALDELKARRRELQDLDDAVSYVRRVAQGRADLARAELARRGAADRPELAADLRHVLGDHLLGASSGRPGRPRTRASTRERSSSTGCAPSAGSAVSTSSTTSALTDLAAALDAFEARVSDERRQVFAELDELTDELVRRYAEQTEVTDLVDDEP